MSYIIEAVKTDGYSGGYLANINGEVRFIDSPWSAFKFSENSNLEGIISSLKKFKELYPSTRFYKFEIQTYTPGRVGDLVRSVLVN